MTTTQKQRLEIACQALDKNEKKAKGLMKDNQGGRCCLCVLQDSAIEQGLVLEKKDLWETVMSNRTKDFFGFQNLDPIIESSGLALSCYNDGINAKEKSHKEIAEMIRKEFLK